MVLKVARNVRFGKYRLIFLLLTMVGTLSNRTFLAWASSGLETAMFNFFFIAWVYICIFPSRRSTRSLFAIGTITTLLCLTRPDGLLFAFSALLIIGLELNKKRCNHTLKIVDFLTLLPLVFIPAHLLWRKLFYNAWLPNTYYAKAVSGLWFDSGMRYITSFVMEYAIWLWIILLACAAIKWAAQRPPYHRSSLLINTVNSSKIIALLTIAGHLLYYTVVIGGDHFEFRVYSHLVPLLFISFIWLLNQLESRALPAALLTSAFIVLSWIIPWTHWHESRCLTTREETRFMKVAVAEAIHRSAPIVPDTFLAYFKIFDKLQFWLINHAICMRHQEHKIFHEYMLNSLPDRNTGAAIAGDNYPVLPALSVGVVSWVLPKVCIIDMLGLNDYTIARTPTEGGQGLMAHDRRPPSGYIECFVPNVLLRDKVVLIEKRKEPLTAEKIAACEEHFFAQASKARKGIL